MVPASIPVDDVRERDLVTEVLSHPQSCRALRILQDVGAPLALADLATEMVRRETDQAGDVRWEQARQYHIMLYHSYVPKLAEAGLVEYDAHQQTVAPVAPSAELEGRMELPSR